MSDIVNAESRENTRNNAGSSENRNVMNTETIEAVAESYHKTGSFKKTAAELNISTSKVRKALLTAGAWSNETAEEIANLRSEHRDWTDQQIATHLHISLNSVQMYTPYKIGPYDGDGDSKGRMAEYRARNRDKAGEADGNRQEVGSMIGSIIEEKDDKADKAVRDDMVSKDDKASNAGAMTGAESIAGDDPFDLPLSDTSWYEEEQRKAKEQGLPFAAIRHNDDPDAMPYVDDQFFLDYRLVEPAHDWDRHPTVSAMKIRLSVDTGSMSNEELEMIEREYGVKTGWTRELILPSYIPLHFLHYVIQRAFGFENLADHVFQIESDRFEAITEESLRSYCRLCGVLFRFPFGNDEEMYWDDDYDGKKSVKTWLKEKYEGYWDTDAGTGYQYVDNQYRIWQWLGDRVTDFHEYAKAFDADEDFYDALERMGAPESYSIGKLDDAGVEELERATQPPQFPVNNILESLSLEDVLSVDYYDIDLDDFEDNLEMAESELLDNLVTLEKARETMKEAQELYKVLEKRMKSGWWDEDVLMVKRWRETAKRAAQLYVLARGGADVPEPFTDTIYYLYDFGYKRGEGLNDGLNDGLKVDAKGRCAERSAKWKIKVQVLEEYLDSSIYYGRNYMPSDANGVSFEKDPEHEIEWCDRLHDMCHWKEKLEVTDSNDRWIRSSDDKDMMIELRPEQQLLDTERAKIEEDRKNRDKWRLEMGYEKEKEVIVDDRIYAAVRKAMLERRPVCIEKEGTEPGEGYPDEKIRNTSIENLV